jgi:hypothetical protein
MSVLGDSGYPVGPVLFLYRDPANPKGNLEQKTQQ